MVQSIQRVENAKEEVQVTRRPFGRIFGLRMLPGPIDTHWNATFVGRDMSVAIIARWEGGLQFTCLFIHQDICSRSSLWRPLFLQALYKQYPGKKAHHTKENCKYFKYLQNLKGGPADSGRSIGLGNSSSSCQSEDNTVGFQKYATRAPTCSYFWTWTRSHFTHLIAFKWSNKHAQQRYVAVSASSLSESVSVARPVQSSTAASSASKSLGVAVSAPSPSKNLAVQSSSASVSAIVSLSEQCPICVSKDNTVVLQKYATRAATYSCYFCTRTCLCNSRV